MPSVSEYLLLCGPRRRDIPRHARGYLAKGGVPRPPKRKVRR